MSEATENHFWSKLEEPQASRRTFLQLTGFGLASMLAGCSRGAPRFAVPSLLTQTDYVPGQPYWIATTSSACGAGCGVLARCLDGRPTKLEGNPQHSLSSGGLCAVCQAAVLGLYDSHRLDGVRGSQGQLSWPAADDAIVARLEQLRQTSGRVRVLTGTLNSPSTLAALEQFLASFSDGAHVMYDALSRSAILDAHLGTHGSRLLPHYDFSRAEVIASFGADFLGTWISPTEFARAYRQGRRPELDPPRMSRHWQFEAQLSLTGSRADARYRLAPWQTRAALSALCSLLEQQQVKADDLALLSTDLARPLEELAEELRHHTGRSLVVCGNNDRASQLLVNRANHALENYGATLDLARPSLQCRGDDTALLALKRELDAGEVDLLLVAGCNPAYDLPGYRESLERAESLIVLSSHETETAEVATWACAESHDLERWDDAEPVLGSYSFCQPTVPALRDARTLRESLARWNGDLRPDRELLRAWWQQQFTRLARESEFEAWFERALHRGFAVIPELGRPIVSTPYRDPADMVTEIPPAAAPTGKNPGLILYPKLALLDGRHAHNPWLQELPDPVTKATWGNYVCVAPGFAERKGLKDGDIVELAIDGQSLELPVLIQPGQHEEVLAVALGYGRKGTDRFSKVGPQWIQGRDTVEPGGVVGANVAPLLRWTDERLSYERSEVSIEPTGRSQELARTQEYHSLSLPDHLAPNGAETRDAARTLSLAALASGHGEHHGNEHQLEGDLWKDDHAYEGYRWGMSIDLAACTGCSACVVACQSENNVPIVGKDEIRRHREMSWIRIDRYYQGEGDDLEVLHQPMMCQHCAQAPCESVCPVLATMHSSEGLNQQVYNRCVGTRYCANNCPYKVRRFNWFDYPHEDALQNMALNPDVTVRSRGVMEKCSMCIQRIQEAKAESRRRGTQLQDGDIQMACQQSCPSEAIVFGDLNDPNSRVSESLRQPRSYRVLTEINTKPVVSYLAKVVNRTAEEELSHE